jgi:hypothetical protein
VCLTNDIWIFVQNINCMCITTHWIHSDWNLHKKVLNFYQVSNHKCETIGKILESCLSDWGIDIILTIILNNESPNENVITSSKIRTKDWKFTFSNNNFIHVMCYHIVNLIVDDELNEMNNLIIKIRIIVKFVRSFPTRLTYFKKCMEKLKVESKIRFF